MKKWLVAAIVAFLVILITVGAVLIVHFISLYREVNQSSPTAELRAVQEYAEEMLPDYIAHEYNAETQTLTLKRASELSYDDACAIGGNIYCDELAPQTYLAQVQLHALDIASHCDCSNLTVVLCVVSTEGKPIFTVSSGNEIWMCWEQ